MPSLTKDLWPLPAESKLVAGSDLITVRNISNPTRITVKSQDVKYSLDQGGQSEFSDKMRLCLNGVIKEELTRLPEQSDSSEFPAILYGRGKGFLGAKPFTGGLLSAVLAGIYPSSAEALREGLAVIVAADGYRAVFSLAEIVNRNDHQEILLTDRKNDDGTGRFAIFPACDFFSDRGVKGIMEINLLIPGSR